jgi:Domain of unknown function (DUF4136)
MRIRQLAAAVALGSAAIALSACASSLQTEVSRYQAMPAPQGQTFIVVPGAGKARPGGLEFERYAALVAQYLAAQGYRPAANAQAANMIVELGYDVDSGKTRINDYGPTYAPFWAHGGWGSPFYPSYGHWGSPFYYGWNDPFWYGRGIDSYVEYHSQLELHIRANGSNLPLFDGRAEARSTTNRLDALLPGLVQALFTGFPGRNGEVVRITIPPANKAAARAY